MFLQLTQAKAQGQRKFAFDLFTAEKTETIEEQCKQPAAKKCRGNNGTPALEPEDRGVFIIRIQFVFLKIQVTRASVFYFSRPLHL